MVRMTSIRTTHVGSLPRTPELLDANLRRSTGDISQDEFLGILQDGVDKVVQRQVDLGLDIINEGEYGHVTSGAVDRHRPLGQRREGPLHPGQHPADVLPGPT